MLGDKAVGKSSIASRFCFDKVYNITLYLSFNLNMKLQ